MKIVAQRRLFWFLKDNIKLDLSNTSVLDMYIQQVIMYGRVEDISVLFSKINFSQFKNAFMRLSRFLPLEVRKFWEDAIGNN
ncbi:hypothetical protein D4R78_04975 [bacterium]|nr:MAG: hypothetical protein D4R78_04975 [bacterium]